MVTVRLKGGMGNQMFQYAFGQGMASRLGTELQIDLSLLLDRARGKDHVYRDFDLTIFKLQPKFAANPNWLRVLYKSKSSKIGKLTRNWVARGQQYVKEPHFHVDNALIQQPSDNTLYEGWWQSQKYFEHVADNIQQSFEFVDEILPESQSLLKSIQSVNSICLNVRRTDFLKTSNLNTTNKDYFINAAHEMAQQVEAPHFFIFSDDVEWCAANLVLPYATTVVSHAHKGRKFGNYMQLMKACKHFIIPNSSYAWWAVWLNENDDKKVIAPKKWFNDSTYNTTDLVPKDWIRM